MEAGQYFKWLVRLSGFNGAAIAALDCAVTRLSGFDGAAVAALVCRNRAESGSGTLFQVACKTFGL